MLSAILLVSGALYVASDGVGECYPPPYIADAKNIVFYDFGGYSTQYLKSGEEDRGNPYIIDLDRVEKWCKACKHGTDKIPFNKFDSVSIVARDIDHISDRIPPYFHLYDDQLAIYTAVDKFQFKYFTPIYNWKYTIYKYVNTQLF